MLGRYHRTLSVVEGGRREGGWWEGGEGERGREEGINKGEGGRE